MSSIEEKRKQGKPIYVWDYFRGGNSPFKPLTKALFGRNDPEVLRKKLEALKLKQELERQKKKSWPERRIES